MNISKSLPILNLVAFIATVFVNFLSQSASVLGVKPFPYTVAELGESRALFFLPAGYVFAIWGVIYLGLAAYAIYQVRPSQRANPLIGKIGWWFVISSIGNITWLVLFLNDQVALSTIAMLVILVSLLVIYLRLGIGRTAVSNTERWAVHIPFGIYLGWITVATVANISAMLYQAGNITSFAGISADIWAVIMMVIAAVLAVAMIFTRNEYAFPLVVVWALVGIYARPFTTPVYSAVSSLNAGMVDAAALLLAVVIVLAIAAHVLLRRQRAGMPSPRPA